MASSSVTGFPKCDPLPTRVRWVSNSRRSAFDHSLGVQALVDLEFEIEHEEDLADRSDPVPWYYPLEGDIMKAQTAWDYFTVWRMSWSGILVTQTTVKVG